MSRIYSSDKCCEPILHSERAAVRYGKIVCYYEANGDKEFMSDIVVILLRYKLPSGMTYQPFILY